MSGPPGSGKTLLARTLPSILPDMTHRESIEVTKIYSVGGLLPPSSPLVTERPFRSPHYTISNAGLVGGGRQPRPGEITLSHRGVLFLDELPEFGHTVLEVLRQPVEDKVVTISRAQGSITFPANFLAGANPRRNSSVLLGGRSRRMTVYLSGCRQLPRRDRHLLGLKERADPERPFRPLGICGVEHQTVPLGPTVRSSGSDSRS